MVKAQEAAEEKEKEETDLKYFSKPDGESLGYFAMRIDNICF